ncbi:putative nucleic acid-binding Zn-ribbon protein [Paenibacillus anaericanus]|uniref:zinc ribbon domain-containing protein n=1 Tax=Paenibacillus anaericanus TaxID=170367 RepID=UPI00277FE031|nr:zinc ribbon domain-containing protein [Paenibacillus anaericanus]MDQ0089475.1 putative nucleic acid-binding Zn-ribbon protein [Paenibacillus anaericanus]
MSMAKFCANCGVPRRENAKFCKECGQSFLQEDVSSVENEKEILAPTETELELETETKIETETEAEAESAAPTEENNIIVTEIEESLIEEVASTDVMTLNENVALTETPELNETSQPPSSTRNRLSGVINQRTKKPLIYGAALLGLILICGVAWSIFASSSSQSSPPLVYIKDFELNLSVDKQDRPITATKKWMDMDEETRKEIDLSSSGEETRTSDTSFYKLGESIYFWVKLNERADRMFYLSKISEDGTASLFYSDPTKLSKSKDGVESFDQGVRISSNLNINQFNPFQITRNGDYALYLKNYEDQSGSLYLYNMKEEILIDNNVADNYYFSEDESSIIYMKVMDDDTSDLYIKSLDSKREKVKIDSGVAQIINYSSDLKKIYYTKSNDDLESSNYYSLYVKEDGKDKRKIISDYSGMESSSMTDEFFFTRTTMNSTKLIDFVEDDMAASDLNITEPVYSDFEYESTYTDYWGYTYTTTDVDYDQYYLAYDLYQDKLDRDTLRSDLEYEELSTITKQLFLYAGGKEKEVSSELAWVNYADAATKSVIYVKSETVKSPTDKMKLSEISSIYDVKDRYETNSSNSSSKYIVLNGGTEQEMSEDASESYRFTFSEDGKKLYYSENENDNESTSGTLVVWDVLEGKLSNRKVIDENVEQYMFVNDIIWYYKDVKDDKGELLTYSEDGKKVKIAYDVQLGNTTVYPEDDVVLYMTDFNTKRLMGSLFMKQGDKSTKISDDVSFYNYNKVSRLFYVSDYRLKNGAGDLWEYRGKDEKKLIDSDVQTMLPIQYGFTF